ncbi:hypothetical protein ACHAXA_008946 [Cyclostephanos tholiformis]|uniref:Uncharacterized protein n=1 Tax=Cyclostephanos tholiformis TaxID=382380 RepID=A0ABD3RU32_9STRA
MMSPPHSIRRPGSVVLFLCLLVSCIDGFAVPKTTSSREVVYNYGTCRASMTLLVGRGIDPPEQDVTRSIENGIQVDNRYEDEDREEDKNEDDDASQPVLAAMDAIPPSPISTGSSSMKGLKFLGHYFGNWLRNLYLSFRRNQPPINVDDTNLLLYDVILLMNLSVSISLFVTHRMDYFFIPSSLNEGALLSICWILAGLANGTFLFSAVDGHYDPRGVDYKEKGGPGGAALLALSTFVTTSSLRIVFALALANMQHRPVGSAGEELIPLEIPFALSNLSNTTAPAI